MMFGNNQNQSLRNRGALPASRESDFVAAATEADQRRI